MKRTFLFLAVAFVLAASAVYSFGNIARPRNTPAPAPGKVVLHTGLTIAPDADTRESTLQISEGTLRLIREQTANTSANASLTGRIAQSSTRTIMAGLFMFLAVSFAGVWLARANQRRSRKAIAAVVLVAAFLGMVTVIVRANAGLPGD